ncbi:MAG: hypothetical protein RR336_08650, partial [Oscillospiraceae bacterium]
GTGDKTTETPGDPNAPPVPGVGGGTAATPEVPLTEEQLAEKAAADKLAAEQEATRLAEKAAADKLAADAEAARLAKEAEDARLAAFAAENPAINGTATAKDVTVTVSAPVGAFPVGTTLTINPVAGIIHNFLWIAEKEVNAAVEAAVEEGEVQQNVAFDITFTHDGQEIQPAPGSLVNVAFSVASASMAENADQLEVFHVDDTTKAATAVGTPVAVDAAATTQKLDVDADSFSIYVVSSVTDTKKIDNINGDVYSADQKPIFLYSSEGKSNHTWSSSKPGIVTVTPAEDGHHATLTFGGTAPATDTKVTITHSYKGGFQKATITVLGKSDIDTTTYPVRFYLQDIEKEGKKDYVFTDDWGRLNSLLTWGFAALASAPGEKGWLSKKLEDNDSVAAWLNSRGIESPVVMKTVAAALEKLVDGKHITSGTNISAVGGVPYTAQYIIDHPDYFTLVYTQVNNNQDVLEKYISGNYVDGNKKQQYSYHVHMSIALQSGTLAVTKTFSGIDPDQKPAGLKITVTDASNTAVATLGMTDSDGILAPTSNDGNTVQWLISGLKPGETYTVTENVGSAAVTGYTLTGTHEATAKAAAGETTGNTNTAKLSNTYTQTTGDLVVTKNVTGLPADKMTDYAVTVKVTDKDGETVEENINFTGTTGTATFKNLPY